MNVNDILTLAKAGFSATQIAAINAAFTSGNTHAAPAPAPTPAPAPAPTPAPAPAPTPALDPNAEILRQLGVISGQITAAAINQTQQPTPQTADDILAEIIAPPKKEG